jgi:hypothetical protein
MSPLPQFETARRAPRLRLSEITPAVLRFHDGRRASGQLQVISITGGLLSLNHPLDLGSQVRLMFLTSKGTVLGTAEMLNPVSYGQQPFRFIELEEADSVRLRATIQSSINQDAGDNWILEAGRQKLRKAIQSALIQNSGQEIDLNPQRKPVPSTPEPEIASRPTRPFPRVKVETPGSPPPSPQDEWIEKYRSTIDRRYRPRTTLSSVFRKFRPQG